MTLTHNAEIVIAHLLKRLDVKVSDSSIKRELSRHPDFPSLLSLSDVLFEWNVNNAAYQIPVENLPELKCPFIASMTSEAGGFVLVTTITAETVTVSAGRNKEKELSLGEFKNNYNGAVLYVEPEPNAGEKDYSAKKLKDTFDAAWMPILLIGSTLILGCAIGNSLSVNGSIQLALAMMLKAFGLGISILLLIQSLDRDNPLIDRICKAGKKIDCNDILNSKAATVFGVISWSEIGFYYFSGTFIVLLFNHDQMSLIRMLMIMNLLALPYTIYSIFYQGFIAKKWCLLCCGIQFILWLEMSVFFSEWFKPSLIPQIHPREWINIAISLAIPVLFWVFIKPFIRKSQEFKLLERQISFNKKSVKIFNALLAEQPKFTLPDEKYSMVLGDPNGKIIITIISSPFCKHCWTAHQILEKWLRFKEGLQVRVVYNIKSELDHMLKASIYLISSSKNKNELESYQTLEDWYAQKHPRFEPWVKTQPANVISLTEAEIADNIAWCKLVDASATPTILINGHKLPAEYRIDDIKYLI